MKNSVNFLIVVVLFLSGCGPQKIAANENQQPSSTLPITPALTSTPNLPPTPSTTPSPIPISIGRVTNGSSLWSGPDTFAYPVLATLDNNDQVNLLARFGRFYQVRYKGQIGFIPTSSIEFQGPIPEINDLQAWEIPAASKVEVDPQKQQAGQPSFDGLGNYLISAPQDGSLFIEIKSNGINQVSQSFSLLDHSPLLDSALWQERRIDFTFGPNNELQIDANNGISAQNPDEVQKFPKKVSASQLTEGAVIEFLLHQGELSNMRVYTLDTYNLILDLEANDLNINFLSGGGLKGVYLRVPATTNTNDQIGQGFKINAWTIPDGTRDNASWLVGSDGIPVPGAIVPISSSTFQRVGKITEFGVGIPLQITYSDDGKLAVIATNIGKVFIYDLSTDRLIQTIDTKMLLGYSENLPSNCSFSDYCGGIALSSDNRLFAVVDAVGTLGLWRTQDGVQLFSKEIENSWKISDLLNGNKTGNRPDLPKFQAGFSNDNSVVAMLDNGTPAALYRTIDGQPLNISGRQKITYGDGNSTSSDLSYIAAVPWLVGIIRIFHSSNLENWEYQELTGYNLVRAKYISADGQLLVLTDQSRRFILLNVETKRPEYVRLPNTIAGQNIGDETFTTLSTDGKLGVFMQEYGGSDYVEGSSEWLWNGQLWDLGTMKPISSFSLPKYTPFAVRKDTQELIYADQNNITFLNLTTGKIIKEIPFAGGCVGNIKLSPKGDVFASSFESRIFICRVSDGALLQEISVPTERIAAVEFSPDGKWIASAGEASTYLTSTKAAYDPYIYLWNVSDGTLVKRLDGHRGNVGSLAFSWDGKQLVSGGYNRGVCSSGGSDNSVLLWDIETGEYKKLATLNKGISDIAITPDDQTAVISSGETYACGGLKNANKTYLLNLNTGRLSEQILNAMFTPEKSEFSSDGKQLFFSRPREVSIFDISSKKLIFDRQLAYGESNAISPDWQIIASAVYASNEIDFVAKGLGSTVSSKSGNLEYTSLIFSNDGYYLYGSGNPPGVITVFGIPPQ